jgi:predicted O-methyltransferase YrrM
MEKAPSIEFYQRFVANQPYERSLFGGSDFDRILFDRICHWSRIPRQSEFVYGNAPAFSQEDMGTDPIMQRFISFLLFITGAKRILEVGTFIGVSAMVFARVMGAQGRVVTIEKFQDHAEVARANVARNGLEAQITILEGDAIEVVAELPRDEPFDLIFLDANKERYLELFLALEPLLAPRGSFLVDDCLFLGDALNDTPTSAKGKGTRALLDHVAQRSDYLGILVPLCSGLFLLTRGNTS